MDPHIFKIFEKDCVIYCMPSLVCVGSLQGIIQQLNMETQQASQHMVALVSLGILLGDGGVKICVSMSCNECFVVSQVHS